MNKPNRVNVEEEEEGGDLEEDNELTPASPIVRVS